MLIRYDSRDDMADEIGATQNHRVVDE